MEPTPIFDELATDFPGLATAGPGERADDQSSIDGGSGQTQGKGDPASSRSDK